MTVEVKWLEIFKKAEPTFYWGKSTERKYLEKKVRRLRRQRTEREPRMCW